MPKDNRYGPGIIKQKNLFYVTMQVPKQLHQRVGKTRLKRSLHTDSISEARRRAPLVLNQWHTEFLGHQRGPLDTAWFKRAHQSATTDEDREVITDIVHDAAWDAHGPTDTWPSEDRDKYEKVLEQVFNVTTDQYLEEYIASKRNRGLRDDSVVKIRKDVEALTDRFPYIDQIKRRDISKWITELLHDKAAPTVRRYKSSWAGYWKYLETIEAVDERTRPFDVEIRGNKRTPAPNRQAFTAADVSKLRLAAANEPHKDTVLDDAILMAVYTGMRAREIAMLTPDDVDLSQRTLTVRDAKTKAGHRTIPIHDALMPIIERAVEAGHENVVEYEAQSKDRSSVFKSRFSRMKERMGYGPELVFHSLRKTVTTTLENAGIAHHVIDAIQGWERKGMIGRYSDGPNLEMMRRAIDAIRY